MEIRNDSNKSIIVLTIIAVCTMIVTLVGATFAYLANDVQNEVKANLDINTSSSESDVFLLNAGDALSIYADESNFYKNAGNIATLSDSSVTLSTSRKEKVTFKYNILLSTTYNNFEYTKGSNAELALILYKEDYTNNCKTSGVCVNNKYEIVNVDKNSCNGTYTFIDNIVDNNKCYKVIATKDITNANTTNQISLMTNEEITAQNGSNTINYKVKLTFINYEHEQNANLNKRFNGILSFNRVN